jgi:hypothetical protein
MGCACLCSGSKARQLQENLSHENLSCAGSFDRATTLYPANGITRSRDGDAYKTSQAYDTTTVGPTKIENYLDRNAIKRPISRELGTDLDMGENPHGIAQAEDFWVRLKAAFSDNEIVDLSYCLAAWIGLGRATHVLGMDRFAP